MKINGPTERFSRKGKSLPTKADKTDKDFFYIMPFEQNKDNIEYKTEDFETYTLSQVKREGEAWIGVEKPRK
jgi:hypothetical protein